MSLLLETENWELGAGHLRPGMRVPSAFENKTSLCKKQPIESFLELLDLGGCSLQLTQHSVLTQEVKVTCLEQLTEFTNSLKVVGKSCPRN